MKKSLSIIVLSILMVLSLLTGCGAPASTESAETSVSESAQQTETASQETQSAEQSAEQLYVIWVNPLVGSSVFTAADNGITAASEEFGFKLKIIGPSILDDTQMLQAVESAIVESPDLIVTTPYNYTALEQTYKKAAEAGIPIINISSDCTEDMRVCFVGTDNTTYGQMAADYVNQMKDGQANVLIMMANLDTSNQLEQKTAFEAKIASDYPGIKVVTTEEDNADSALAIQKFQDVLKAHPEIDTILCLEGNGGSAAAVVLKEMDKVGEVSILAIDDNEDTLQYIRDGVIWGTMAQNFYKMGYLGGQLASEYLAGGTVESVYDSGTVLVTVDNIDTYAEEFYK